MPVRFDCPSCKANYEVADDLSGKMIMCRVCKKRGSVRNQTAAASSTVLPSAASLSSSAPPSRRTFLIRRVLASLAAIGAGALLARRPWRHWGKAPPSPDDRRGRGRFRGPPPGGDQKDGKG